MSKAKSKPATVNNSKENGLAPVPSDDVMVLSDSTDDVMPVTSNNVQAKPKPSKAKAKG